MKIGKTTIGIIIIAVIFFIIFAQFFGIFSILTGESVLVLRPDANGIQNQWANFYHYSGDDPHLSNWQTVSEEIVDDMNGIKTSSYPSVEYYSFANPPCIIRGIIEKVTVHFRAGYTAPTEGMHGGLYLSIYDSVMGEENVSTQIWIANKIYNLQNFQDYSYDFNLSTKKLMWTWNDISNLQIGIESFAETIPLILFVAQIYVEVYYVLSSDISPPSADFLYLPDKPVKNEIVTFTDVSRGDANSGWEWNFGDGSTASGQTVQHTYEAEGVYEAKLTVTGKCAEDIASKWITIYETEQQSGQPQQPQSPVVSPIELPSYFIPLFILLLIAAICIIGYIALKRAKKHRKKP